MEKDIKDAQRLCDVFNDDVAPAFRVKPITPEEIEEYLQAAAHREADKITSLARAKAELSFRSRFSACSFVVDAIRLTETPESLRRLLGVVDGQ